MIDSVLVETLAVGVVGGLGVFLAIVGAGRACADAVRTSRARRRHAAVLGRVAVGLGFDGDAIDDAGDGALAVTLAAVPNGEGLAWEGGYRGGRPPEVQPVSPDARHWTSVSASYAGAPMLLRVRPGRWAARLERTLGFGGACATGDPLFDEVFVVETGSPDDAPVVLGVEMRRALLRLPRSAQSPRLTVDGITLRVEWHGEPDPPAVQRVVAALRSARWACGIDAD